MPRLSEAARHLVIPDGIVTTDWPIIDERCREMGVVFDDWQQGLGAVTFGKRADGKYAATVGGIVMSIPRQVGKTFFVGMVVIALATLYPGMTILWTAHRTRTSTQTFKTMQGMVRRKKIAPFLAPTQNNGVRSANGEQEILFANGSIIMFGAREGGFGRGFDEVDIEVFDEAQILTEKALEDMVAATNQSRHEAGALLFFMGTPPRPVDNGEEFLNRRREALSGESEDMVYVEFSADSGADLSDWEQVAKANPSFPARTSKESIKRLAKNLTSLESRQREGLGIWDEEAASERAIDPQQWDALTIPAASPDWKLAAIGLDMDAAGRMWLSIAAHADGGVVHVELVDHDPLDAGVDAAVAWLWRQCRRRIPVVFPSDSGASVLEAPLQAKGMKTYRLNITEIAQISTGLAQATRDGTVSHVDDAVLETCVRESTRQGVKSGGWRMARVGDLQSAPLYAAACARHGAVKWSKRRTGGTESKGEVVVL